MIVSALCTTYLTASQINGRLETNNFFKMVTNTLKIVPWNVQANELNFEKVILWRLSQVSWNSKAL